MVAVIAACGATWAMIFGRRDILRHRTNAAARADDLPDNARIHAVEHRHICIEGDAVIDAQRDDQTRSGIIGDNQPRLAVIEARRDRYCGDDAAGQRKEARYRGADASPSIIDDGTRPDWYNCCRRARCN